MKRLATFLVGMLAGIGAALAAVNLNSATVAELDAVKGIGPGKAKAIVEYRDKNGPFKSVDDLANVKGFGAKSIDKLRAELSVGNPAPAATVQPGMLVAGFSRVPYLTILLSDIGLFPFVSRSRFLCPRWRPRVRRRLSG